MNQDSGFHATSSGMSGLGTLLLPGGAGASIAGVGLPDGWLLLGRSRFGTAGPGPFATGCHVLAHPRIGVALLDIAPGATPNAEARLRRALGVAGFWSAFPGTLPIWHGRVARAELPELDRILQAGFAALEPLSLRGGPGWITGLRRSLERSPTWDVPGHRPPRTGTALVLTRPRPGPPPAPRPRPRRRLGPLLFLGFVASFWIGLATGLVLIGGSDTAPVSSPRAAVAVPPSPPPAETVVSAGAPPPAAAVPEPSPPPPQGGTVAGGGSVPAMLGEAVTSAASRPPGPAQPSAAGVRPATRGAAQSTTAPRPTVDRACRQALFRFQQGEALSPAELVHLREGCATRR